MESFSKKTQKLNTSGDVIPISQATHSSDDSPQIISRKRNKTFRSNNTCRDPTVKARVQDYLHENEDKVYIDVTEMADTLMKKYRDYRNKKRDPFRRMVRSAYNDITESLRKKTDNHSKLSNIDDDEDDDDDDEYDDEEDNEIEIQVSPNKKLKKHHVSIPSEWNGLHFLDFQSDGELPDNDEILKMYKKSYAENKNGNAELIDISSDDDNHSVAAVSTATADAATVAAAAVATAVATVEKKKDISIEKTPHVKNNTTATSTSTPTVASSVQGHGQTSVSNKNSNHNCHSNKVDTPIRPTLLKSSRHQSSDTPASKKIVTIIKKQLNETPGDQGKKRPRDKILDNPITPVQKKRKDTGFTIKPQETRYKFCDIGGNPKVLESVIRLLIHMRHPELFKQLGVTPTRGFLLHGPPGCGKSLMAHAIAGELGVPFLKISAPELIAGVSGESESRIRELFEQSLSLAPCVLFFDEIDALVPNRANSQKEMERRIVAQLLSCLDELSFRENGDKILVLGATNRPETIDPALRRAGRFDREISMGIPDKACRAKILEIHCKNKSLSSDIDIQDIAAKTPGFVGADLVSLIREAAIAAIDRVFKSLKEKKESLSSSPSTTTTTTTNEPDVKVTKESNNTNENKEDDNVKELKTNDSPIDTNEVNETKEAESTTENDKSKVVENEDNENIPQSSTNDINVVQNDVEKKADILESLLEMLHTEVAISDDDLKNFKIENIDFETAFRVVQPSSKREGFATVPDVTWNDIGSLKEIREELKMAILAPVKYSSDFAAFGLNTPTGVLLCGPPGCGKTLLAKAIANEAEINFISVKGPELLNMYVGESEKAVRQCFVRARDSAPCVIFFDEIDALCPKRTDGDNSSTSRIVNQVLTEMDGVEGRKGVYLMAATNRPDILDPAVMRPGRFDKILYVGLPTPDDRVDILRALTKNGTVPKFADDTSMEIIGKSERCNRYTGADLAGLVREAATAALKESMANKSRLTEVSMRHVEIAFDKVRPSVQEKDAKHYEKLRKLYTVQKQKDTSDENQPEVSAVINSINEEPMET